MAVLLPLQEVIKHTRQLRRLGPHDGTTLDPLNSTIVNVVACMGKALTGLTLAHGVGRTAQQAKEQKTPPALETCRRQ